MAAQLTQLTSLSVVATSSVNGPDGRPVPASELLGGLPALSRLTRLTSLKVEGPPDRGLPAQDLLRALPPGAPLTQVRHWGGLGLGCRGGAGC